MRSTVRPPNPVRSIKLAHKAKISNASPPAFKGRKVWSLKAAPKRERPFPDESEWAAELNREADKRDR